MNEIKLLFDNLNSIFENNSIKNNLKAKEARDLFERALKFKLNIPREEYYKLSALYSDYLNQFNPDGIEYTGKELIKRLNHFSHDTPDLLTDSELEGFFLKLNKIFTTIFDFENTISHTLSPVVNNTEIFSNLNREQEEAVNSKARITLVNAGPGTGKTHLIVDRIIRRAIESSNKKVIGLSFTNQASLSLKNKLEFKIFGTNHNITQNNIFIGTIHSFAFNSLKSFHTDILKVEFDYEIIDEEEYNEIKNEFNNNKTYILNFLVNNKLLTFDKILKDFMLLLKNNNKFNKYMSESIQEIIIDEAQDLDKIQYEIFNELFNNSSLLNLFLVGDQRQNIFDFIGGNINNFSTIFENESIKEYALIESYRCPNKILEFVNSFQFSDCENIKLTNKTVIGEKPNFEEFKNKIEESIRISNYIGNLLTEENNLKDFAILAPSSFYFDIIAAALNKNNIPFKVFGGQTILDSKIRFLLNILKSILLQKKYSLLKVISFWDSHLKIEKKEFLEILKYFDKNKPTSKEFSPKLLLSINFINENLDLEQDCNALLKKFILFSSNNKIFSDVTLKMFESFLKTIKELKLDDIENINSKLTPNSDEFFQYYQKTSNIKYKEALTDEYVTLSTIHSAKGKEWDFVLIPGLTQDIFPRYNSDYNTELKKFYVACTRAKSRLFLLRPISYQIPKKDGFGFWSFTKEKSIFFKNVIPEYVVRSN